MLTCWGSSTGGVASVLAAGFSLAEALVDRFAL